MLCVLADANGFLYLQSPQPADVSTCAYVVSSGSELGNMPWNLTLEQGAEIGMSMFLALAIAWGFRMIGRHFFDPQEGDSNER
jgi:Na+/H+ antiporter NhaC